MRKQPGLYWMSWMENSTHPVFRQIQVSVPYTRLIEEFLPLVLENRINPEIGLDARALCTFDKHHFENTLAALQGHNARISLHAPFMDLAPGAVDDSILEATRARLQLFADRAPLFDPVSIVFHTGWDRKRYLTFEDVWLDNAYETFAPVFKTLIRDTRASLAIENVYEKTPRMLVRLLDRFRDPRVGWCLDPGHAHAFSHTPLNEWLNTLGDRIRVVHVHDNRGSSDEHLAVGDGTIDFGMVFRFLKKGNHAPVITCEAHTVEDVLSSLDPLEQLLGL